MRHLSATTHRVETSGRHSLYLLRPCRSLSTPCLCRALCDALPACKSVCSYVALLAHMHAPCHSDVDSLDSKLLLHLLGGVTMVLTYNTLLKRTEALLTRARRSKNPVLAHHFRSGSPICLSPSVSDCGTFAVPLLWLDLQWQMVCKPREV